MRARIDEIVFDCADPAALARFWASLVGGEPQDRDATWSYIDVPDFTRLAFQRVPEGKSVKNRLHIDLVAEDIPKFSAEAVELGAELSGGIVTDEVGSFQVLLDPEGNEFCFVSD
ncbi:glyoxalase [Streptomyces spiroverticillatus]|uniref:Glyoxalase n=1 Tax=Streptomyces finlayi TaxID=67296 RepID=A0A919CDW8_9ACTN|nr:VOC family protein [Streptomyces finlayi]GHA28845.1 glyoxalase [Streptomyces spiroverticillatus]GHD09457.1 glyoxalase [Streptomyces finlayi]